MKKLFKRGLAFLLSVSLCFGLSIPVLADTDGNSETNAIPVSAVDKTTLGAVLGDGQDQGGLVASWTDFDANGIGYLDIGVYNAYLRSAFSVTFDFDSTIMSLFSPGNDMEITVGDFGDVYKDDYLSQIPASLMANSTAPSTNWVTGNLKAPQVLQATPANTASQIGDKIKVTLEYATLTNEQMATAQSKNKYVSSFINGTNLVFAQDEVISLWKVAFKQKSQNSNIAANTFSFSEALTKWADSSSVVVKSRDIALFNFPEAEAQKYSVTFNTYQGEGTSTPLSGVTVDLFESSAAMEAGTKLASVTTESGTAAIPASADYFKDGATYFYKASMDGYLQSSGSFSIQGGDKTVQVNLTSQSTAQLPVDLSVADADTNEPIASGSISIGGTSYSIENGKVKNLNLAVSTSGYTVSDFTLSGYSSMTVDNKITIATNDNFLTGIATPNVIKVNKYRAKVEIPKTPDSIQGGTVTVSVKGNTKLAGWSSTGTKTYSISELQAGSNGGLLIPDLPGNATFSITYEATGYASSSPIYAKVGAADADGNATATIYGADAVLDDSGSVTSGTEISNVGDYTPDLTIMSDPLYDVQISKSDSTFTAAVKLKNIDAINGTFGISYDPELINFDESTGFTLSDKVELNLSQSDTAVQSSTQKGYHVFQWQAKGANSTDGAALKTTAAEELIATYTFTFKTGKDERSITPTTFSIRQFDKTDDAQTQINSMLANNSSLTYSDAYDLFASEYYRYTDSLNDYLEAKFTAEEAAQTPPPLPDGITEDDLAGKLRSGLTKGFIAKYKEISIDGFYQVLNANTAEMNDVQTIITTDFDAKKSSLDFNVTDESGAPINNAVISLYEPSEFSGTTLNSDAKASETLSSDNLGTSKITLSGGQTYGYSVSKDGYWLYPKDTPSLSAADKSDIKVVTIGSPDAKSQSVQLQTKVYHDIFLKNYDASTQNILGDVTAADAALGGGNIAYNGIDYVIRITPAAGKEIDKNAAIRYYIDPAAAPKQEEPSGAMAVGTSTVGEGWMTAAYNASVDGYVIPKSSIKGFVNIDADGNKVAADPAKGFKSTNLYIAIVAPTESDVKPTYTITAQAGSNGKVEYTPVATETPDPDTDVKKEVTVDLNASSGTFTFTADAGYVVEKVIIDGGEIDTWDDKNTFELPAFTNVNHNHDIAVTFWNGTDPSSDAIVTLMAGDKGKVSVTEPADTGIADITNQSKTFIMTPGSLKITATPADAVGDVTYVLDKVTKNSEDITESYSDGITVPAGETLITVGFKVNGADNPISVFVNSYVETGSGNITPYGTNVYAYGDAPTFILTGQGTYNPASVKVNGIVYGVTKTTAEKPEDEKYTYLISPALVSDTNVGAMFEEKAYAVYGKVDWAQGKNTESNPLIKNDINTPGKIVFTRTEDGLSKIVYTTLNRTESVFNALLPDGTWNMKLTKKGYLNYTITGIVVEGADIYLGGTSEETIKAIVPLIGDTSGKGAVVSITSAGVVSNSLRSGITEAMKLKGDVDDDNDVGVTTDMAFVKENYLKYETVVTYSDFKA